MRLFHGGIADLKPGAIIEPGHSRRSHEGCPWCEARAAGHAGPGGLDGPSAHTDRVYATPNKLYARHYASLWGRGDLYRVEPIGDPVRSVEDSIESWHAASLRVLSVIERAVLLTNSERRRLMREWTAADLIVGGGS